MGDLGCGGIGVAAIVNQVAVIAIDIARGAAVGDGDQRRVAALGAKSRAERDGGVEAAVDIARRIAELEGLHGQRAGASQRKNDGARARTLR